MKFQNTSAGDWRFGQCKYVPLARYFSLEARGPGGVRAKSADGPPFLENQDVHPHKVLIVPPGGWQEMEVVLAPGRDGDDADGYVPGDVFPVLGKKPGVYRLTFTLHVGSRTPVGQGALDVRLGGR
ncbi:MAG: hypothetical protein HYV15_03995 [Elusimicrobia bacterium]|nr:hypothetical protein [Elusimicrobiota bacterium]